MRAGYIVVKTRQGIEMCRHGKVIDGLCARLESVAIYRPDLGLENISLEVFNFCEEMEGVLHKASERFSLMPGGGNAEFYRQIIRDSRIGKRRRLKMKTSIGEKLFRLILSVDRMCTVVGMLHRQQVISSVQARQFLEVVASMLRDLADISSTLGRILKNAEAVFVF